MFIISSVSKKDSVITRNFFTRYKTREKKLTLNRVIDSVPFGLK